MISKNEESNNFSANLKTLCSYYKSISEVCRKIDINRQQFNRYLNGNTFPSYSNLKRMCDFFGVDQDEIVSNPIEFSKTVSPMPLEEKSEELPGEILEYVSFLKNSSKNGLDRYVGYYYRYILSGSFPGHILKSLIRVYKKNDYYYYWHVENVTSKSSVIKRPLRHRYNGIVFMISERIYMIELEAKLKSTISETIMMPSYQHGNKNISGITCYSTSDTLHQPVSCRAFHEYIGETINTRQALNNCDLITTDSTNIAESIKEEIFTPSLSPTAVLQTK